MTDYYLFTQRDYGEVGLDCLVVAQEPITDWPDFAQRLAQRLTWLPRNVKQAEYLAAVNKTLPSGATAVPFVECAVDYGELDDQYQVGIEFTFWMPECGYAGRAEGVEATVARPAGVRRNE